MCVVGSWSSISFRLAVVIPLELWLLAETMRGRLVIPAVRGRCDAANGSCDRLCFRISTKSRSTEPIPRESGRRARADVRPGSFSRTVIDGGVVELKWDSKSAETERDSDEHH
jgi:hypothetical protein